MVGLGHLSEICFHGSGGLQEVIKVTGYRIFSLKQEIKCKNLWKKIIIYFKSLYFFLNNVGGFFFFLWVYLKIIRVKMFYFNSSVFQNNLWTKTLVEIMCN